MVRMKHTPLERFDLVHISLSAHRRAMLTFPNEGQHFKRLGHQLQWTHDAEYTAAGMPITLHETSTELFDRRTYDARFLYDDKVCTFVGKDGEIKSRRSDRHYISNDECVRWDRHLREVEDGDVLIMSFDYVDEQHDMAIYQGAISWRAARGYVKEGLGSYELFVPSARQHNLV